LAIFLNFFSFNIIALGIILKELNNTETAKIGHNFKYIVSLYIIEIGYEKSRNKNINSTPKYIETEKILFISYLLSSLCWITPAPNQRSERIEKKEMNIEITATVPNSVGVSNLDNIMLNIVCMITVVYLPVAVYNTAFFTDILFDILKIFFIYFCYISKQQRITGYLIIINTYSP